MQTWLEDWNMKTVMLLANWKIESKSSGTEHIAYYDKEILFWPSDWKLIVTRSSMNSMKNFQEVRKVCHDLKNTKKFYIYWITIPVHVDMYHSS